MTYSLKSGASELSLYSPVIMGIVNLTTDSFYEDSRLTINDEFVEKIQSMIDDGAKIIDLGAQSTRPGASLLSAETELMQLLAAVEIIKSNFPEIWISIDTFYSEVAEACLKKGVHMINDISAGEFDPKMLELIAQYQIPYVAMHKKGDPQSMQQNPTYENVVGEVMEYFIQKSKLYREMGIQQWVLDLGYGFGKTVEHNYQLLNHSKLFEAIGQPILTGISRKSMIYKPLNINPQEALNGTTALNMIALENGSHILRVHDVKEASECIKLHGLLKNKS